MASGERLSWYTFKGGTGGDFVDRGGVARVELREAVWDGELGQPHRLLGRGERYGGGDKVPRKGGPGITAKELYTGWPLWIRLAYGGKRNFPRHAQEHRRRRHRDDRGNAAIAISAEAGLADAND